jgi:3-oxoacyl-[acyl-carrier-protein] synthase II
MAQRRVVITGIGLASPIGNTLDAVSSALREGRHGVRTMPEWDGIGQLGTRLAAPVLDVERADFPRKMTRTMGRVGILSLYASEAAIADAGIPRERLSLGDVGVAYGSTHGSSSELEKFCTRLFGSNSLAGLEGSAYLTFMSHTCAANLAIHYGIRGRVISTCSACVSSSQGIGAAYEAIKFGQQRIMLAGGAEELHFTHAGVFDIMYATSRKYNDAPELSPRPFDTERDGLVVGEGAATLILEELEDARARGAKIYAEVLGYGTNCDGQHVTRPSSEGMGGAMALALADSGLERHHIDYINMHGTATEQGDIAESAATLEVLGDKIPVSSTKSFTGHTLGACGGLEAIFCLAMFRDDFVPHTRNLERVDPRCAPLDYIMGGPRPMRLERVMSNNFAFGGINTSLILGRI